MTRGTEPDATALAWARARAAGPLWVPAGTPTPDGMLHLPAGPAPEARTGGPLGNAGEARVGGLGGFAPEANTGGGWLVPQVPETADARVLAELGLASPLLEQPNDTARLLAAALRCCWADPLAPIWPGVTVPAAPVLAVFGELTGPRDEMAHRRSAVAGLRRLDQAGWLIWDETADTIRLGPRVALWSTSDLTTLRQLWRATPGPTA
jgi:hypothetical protein